MQQVGSAPRAAPTRGSGSHCSTAAAGRQPACPAPSAPMQPPARPRDVGAGVFGTWGSPPPLVNPRRFLDMAAFAGTLVLPRPQEQQQRERERAAQQRRERQRQREWEAQQAAQQAAAAAAEGKKPLRLSWAGSGIYFW
jgi:hypothetical protein